MYSNDVLLNSRILHKILFHLILLFKRIEYCLFLFTQFDNLPLHILIFNNSMHADPFMHLILLILLDRIVLLQLTSKTTLRL